MARRTKGNLPCESNGMDFVMWVKTVFILDSHFGKQSADKRLRFKEKTNKGIICDG